VSLNFGPGQTKIHITRTTSAANNIEWRHLANADKLANVDKGILGASFVMFDELPAIVSGICGLVADHSI